MNEARAPAKDLVSARYAKRRQRAVVRIKRDDLTAVFVNASVQFALVAAFRSSMLFKQPFARAAKLHPRPLRAFRFGTAV